MKKSTIPKYSYSLSLLLAIFCIVSQQLQAEDSIIVNKTNAHLTTTKEKINTQIQDNDTGNDDRSSAHDKNNNNKTNNSISDKSNDTINDSTNNSTNNSTKDNNHDYSQNNKINYGIDNNNNDNIQAHSQKSAFTLNQAPKIIPAAPFHDNVIDPKTNTKLDSVYSVQIPSLLTLQQAQKFLTQVSPKLAAEQANIQSKQWQREAVDSMDQPLVFARASASAHKLQRDFDLTGTKKLLEEGINEAQPKLLEGLDQLGIQLPPLGNAVTSKLPDVYKFSKSNHSLSAGVGVVYPIYTAGRVSAIEGILDARTFEAKAQSRLTEDELYTTLVQHYFDSQLTIIFAALSKDALDTIQQTDHMAERLYEEGFISLVDRMEAQTALASSKSDFIKIRNISRLKMRALQSLLRTTYRIRPTTPLFISTKPLKKLSYYHNIALNNHPGLKIVEAKRGQAQESYNLSDTGHKPTVSMFGYVDAAKKPSWVAGVSATWTFSGGIDKSAMRASSRAQMRQADLSALELKDNLLLVVEKYWNDVHNAQARYEALQANVDLSYKVLELRKLGMQEGVNTAIEIVQAQTLYLKATTEQAQAVNDYVQSLAKLMQSCGTPLDFNHYLAEADVFLPKLYPQSKKTETKK